MLHFQSSCIRDRDEPKPKELPPITTEGRNTIGFLLNGEVWLPGGGAIGSPDKEFVLDTQSNIFLISTYFDNRSTVKSRQELYVKCNWFGNKCSIGDIDMISEVGPVYFRDVSVGKLCQIFNKLNSYQITITYCDLANRIISGEFELEIENECGDVYRITEGRFDGRFRYF